MKREIEFTTDQIEALYGVMEDHQLIHAGEITLDDARSRALFSELAVKLMRQLDQKQHTQLQRLV